MRAALNCPDVILDAFKLGILSTPNVPELILDAAMDPLIDPTVNKLLLGLYFRPASTRIGLLPVFEPTKATN